VTESKRLQDVHTRSMRLFDAVYAVEAPQRKAALIARRFEAIRGASYEGQGAPVDADEQDGESGGTARLEIPTFLRPIRRVRGQFRASRKTVDFKTKGDNSDRASADNLDGLYRADENESVGGGQHAYDNAFTEGSGGGMGAWRYVDRYEDDTDEKNEHQRIRIETIYDADQSVWFDGDAKAQNKSDAKRAWLLFTMSRDAFEEDYPDASPTTFSDTNYGWSFDWTQPETITLCRYFEVEDQSVTRRTYRQTALDEVLEGMDDIEPEEVTHDDEELKMRREDGSTLLAELRAQGFRQVKVRKIKRQRVRQYIMSGAECLEDEGYIAGSHIPIVPFYMERSYVGGIERFRGLVEPVMDAARLFNLGASNLGDAASGPTEKTPIFAPEQVSGALGAAWASRKVNRPAYLLANPIYGPDGETILAAGPTGWVEPDQIQPATAAVLTIAGQAIDTLMGVNAEAETVPSNTSSAAIQLVNERADVHDILWEDNFSIAMQWGGEIWLSKAQELYVEDDREMVAIDQEGKQSKVKLNQPAMDDGGQHRVNDLTTGRYDVIVDVGPATKTRRDAVVKAMSELGAAYQAAGNMDNANAALGIAVLSTEGEGTDQFREYVRKQGVQAGWAEPTAEEKAALEAAQGQQQPDPNAVVAQAQMILAQAEVAKAEVQKMEAETKRITAQANLQVAQAKAAVALASIPRDDAKQLLAEVKAETDSDRADDEHSLDVARTTTEFERHDRDMAQPQGEQGNGNAA